MRGKLLVAYLVVAFAVAGASWAGSASGSNLVNEQGTISALQTENAGLRATISALESPTPGGSAASSGSGNGSSRTSPVGFGADQVVGDYLVHVSAVNTDAETIVLAENMFNEPAGPGNSMLMVTLDVTYQGEESGSPFWDLTWHVVGSAGRAYSSSDNSCGVIPMEAYEAPDLFTGANTQFNLCWVVPDAEAGTFLLMLEETFSFDGDPVYFSLEQ